MSLQQRTDPAGPFTLRNRRQQFGLHPEMASTVLAGRRTILLARGWSRKNSRGVRKMKARMRRQSHRIASWPAGIPRKETVSYGRIYPSHMTLSLSRGIRTLRPFGPLRHRFCTTLQGPGGDGPKTLDAPARLPDSKSGRCSGTPKRCCRRAERLNTVQISSAAYRLAPRNDVRPHLPYAS